MKIVSSAIVLSVTFASSQALCWGDLGHQTVGEIAQRHLTPETKRKIEQIMGAEILQAASIWPDIVRSDNRHKTFGNYHFLDVPAGMKYVDIKPEKKAKRNGDTVIQNFGGILLNGKRNRDEKMLAIRYLAHVIGDVHQPLHVGNSYDMGANTCNVRLRLPHLKQEKLLNLHSLWDEEIIEFVKEDVRAREIAEAKKKKLDAPPKRFFGASVFADMIISGNKDVLALRAEIQNAEPSVWYQESADVRTNEVYPDKEAGLKFPVDEAKRAYCVNVKDPSQKKVLGKLPVLGEKYLSAKVKVVERQIYKAGLRLAHTLNALAKSAEFINYAEGPTELLSCPLSLKPFKDCRKAGLPEKDQWTSPEANLTVDMSPSEQAMARVLNAETYELDARQSELSQKEMQKELSAKACGFDFLRDLYLARHFDEHCLIK